MPSGALTVGRPAFLQDPDHRSRNRPAEERITLNYTVGIHVSHGEVDVPTPIPTAAPAVIGGTTSIDSAVAMTDVLVNGAQVFAFVAGGFWAVRRFRLERKGQPKATLVHQVEHFDLGTGKRFVRVTVRVENTGDVLLKLVRRRSRLQQVLPVDQEAIDDFWAESRTEVRWLQFGDEREFVYTRREIPEIEPGETEQFEDDYIIDADVEVVQAYSHFDNESRGEADPRGWPLTTIHDLREEQKTEEKVENRTGREG